MNAIAAIAQAFLKGEILTIKTAFRDFGVSNLPRECSRSIEQKFGVRISKLRRQGKSRFGLPITWYEYRINRDDPSNAEGIQSMIEYIKSNGGEAPIPKRPVGRPKQTETPSTHNVNPLF